MFPSHDPLTVTSAPSLGPRLVVVTPLPIAPEDAPHGALLGELQLARLEIAALDARLTAVEARLATPWWRRLWTWLTTDF